MTWLMNDSIVQAHVSHSASHDCFPTTDSDAVQHHLPGKLPSDDFESIVLVRFAGRLLELDLKQNWSTEAQKMQDHITQMATVMQSSIEEIDARSTTRGQACSAG